jgi:hypothetical protein
MPLVDAFEVEVVPGCRRRWPSSGASERSPTRTDVLRRLDAPMGTRGQAGECRCRDTFQTLTFETLKFVRLAQNSLVCSPFRRCRFPRRREETSKHEETNKHEETGKRPVMAALTDEERQALLRQSHPVHGEPAGVRTLDVSRLLAECHRLMLPERNTHTASLEILCLDMAVLRNLVCGGEAAFLLIECKPEAGRVDGVEVGEREDNEYMRHDINGEVQVSTSGRRVASLLAAIVDTYFDADMCSNTEGDTISMLLDDANVALLAKARRIAGQMVVNACSSSARWRSSIAACLFPRRFTCLALTDDVRVVGSLAYALHTMVNIDEVDPSDDSLFRMEHLVQIIALMLQVEARYGVSAEGEAATDASLEIMLTHLCLRRGRLKDVVRGLCFGPPEAGLALADQRLRETRPPPMASE